MGSIWDPYDADAIDAGSMQKCCREVTRRLRLWLRCERRTLSLEKPTGTETNDVISRYFNTFLNILQKKSIIILP